MKTMVYEDEDGVPERYAPESVDKDLSEISRKIVLL